ncbi:hypothetical protein NXH76_11965 [Blautia schinkii]|nr:hypothetical protein [Blautia schinkii]
MKEIKCSRCGRKIHSADSVNLIAEAYSEDTEKIGGVLETLGYNLRHFATVVFTSVLSAKTPELCQDCAKAVFRFARGGLIPPVQPGDTVYKFDYFAGEVEPMKVVTVLLADAGNEIEVECRGKSEYYYQDEIGEVIFLTEKEAERGGKNEAAK